MDFRRLGGKDRSEDARPNQMKVWCFTRGAWHETDLMLPSGDLDDALRAVRYDFFTGWKLASLELSVHVPPGRGHYLIQLVGNDTFEVLLAADLPSLLDLLPRLTALAKDAAILDAAEDRREKAVGR